LTTLLVPRRIVLAKLLAALRVSTVLTFLLTEQILLAYILLPELARRFWTLLVFFLIIAMTCLATTTIGLLCSSLARRTATAIVITYLSLLTLFALPIGVAWYLQGLDVLSPEQLSAITVTSPYSAALSVPVQLQPSPHDQPGERTFDSALPTPIPFANGLGLPVWGVFLLIYPPICAILFGITCLIFRIRWWSAAESV
jgi:hypothetical protein